MSIQKLVVAIDPGGTTGVAIKTFNETLPYITVALTSPEEVYDFLWARDFSHIIVENFQAQTISKWGLHTVRIVGGCYAIAHIKQAIYVHHMPQDRYPFQKEAKAILLKTKSVIHEQDALAHLLRWEHDNGY